MQSWPDDLFDFAWFPDRMIGCKKLADQAEEEDWQYQHTQNEHDFPILFNYLKYHVPATCRGTQN